MRIRRKKGLTNGSDNGQATTPASEKDAINA